MGGRVCAGVSAKPSFFFSDFFFFATAIGSETGYRLALDDPLTLCIQTEARTFVFAVKGADDMKEVMLSLQVVPYLAALDPLPRATLLLRAANARKRKQ